MNLLKSKIDKEYLSAKVNSTALSGIEKMEKLKITSLLVSQNKNINKKNKKVVGILHLHHCLNRGIK